MGSREVTIIELDGARLSALSANVTAGGVDIARWHTATRPESVAPDNAKAVGEWLGKELKDAGIPRSRVILAMARNDVVLKPLTLPASDDLNEASIAGAVRLQMVRQLTMSMDGTAIDYMIMPGRAQGTIGVIAGAMPGHRVQWARDVAAAAGCKLKRIGLRCSGAAALLAELSQRRSGPVLGIAVGATTTEFVIVEDGQMMLARVAELPRPESASEYEAFVQRLAVEAKRTWMSYRSATPGLEVDLVAVLGDGELAREVASACGKGLGVPGEMVPLPSLAARSCNVPEAERGTMAALAGLLIEGVVGKPGLDFANPRKAPDLAARRRQGVLAAALVLIVVGGFGLVASKKSLGSMQAKLDTLRAEEGRLKRNLDQYLALHARVNHIEQWKNARVDWLPHIHKLSETLPSPHDSTTDEINGKFLASTFYDPKGKSQYPGGEWTTRVQTVFNLDGKVDNRTIAAGLRERILSDKIYTVESRGPDVPDRYAIELATHLPRPELPPPPPEKQKPAPKKAATPEVKPEAKPENKTADAATGVKP
ncbi:MAG TPA: hypothetical protein VD997_00695 [Phycisphaerales bacterium]|nr:hypothetical protein [Phycisphaerales bacterium]